MTMQLLGQSRTFTWLDLAAMGLAVLYLTMVITGQDGPWNIFRRWREWQILGGLTACAWCTSPYVAAGVFVVYWFVPGLIWPFALAGLALCLRTYTGVLHNG